MTDGIIYTGDLSRYVSDCLYDGHFLVVTAQQGCSTEMVDYISLKKPSSHNRVVEPLTWNDIGEAVGGQGW